MELRFASCTLNKPVIMAVVGTGDKWLGTEVSYSHHLVGFVPSEDVYL